jgi:hypothetical protein
MPGWGCAEEGAAAKAASGRQSSRKTRKSFMAAILCLRGTTASLKTPQQNEIRRTLRCAGSKLVTGEISPGGL